MKTGMIIVTGPDKVGKTTLIQALTPRLQPDIIYKGKPRSETDALMLCTALFGMVVTNNLMVLCDRFHFPDHAIYTHALGLDRPTKYFFKMGEQITKSLREQQTPLIFLDLHNEQLVERHLDVKDDYVSCKQAVLVAALYREVYEVMRRAGYNVIRIDTTDKTPQMVEKEVLEHMEWRFLL